MHFVPITPREGCFQACSRHRLPHTSTEPKETAVKQLWGAPCDCSKACRGFGMYEWTSKYAVGVAQSGSLGTSFDCDLLWQRAVFLA